MTRNKQWLYVLVAVLGSGVPRAAFCDDTSPTSTNEANTSVVRLASTSTWNADPETTPAPAPAPTPFTDDPVQPTDSPTTDAAATTPAAAGCGESCYCAPEYSLIASAEATFFWPQFQRGFLTSSVDTGSGPNDFRSGSQVGSTEGSVLVAPRISLGIQGCKWGLVGRYWYASQWATGYTPADPALAPAGVISFDGFRAYTLDLEVQRRWYCGEWTLYSFFGGRYAMVDNDRSLVSLALSGVTTATGSAFATQQFGGTGITFGNWGIRPICCDSPLKYFFANRYSFIFGKGGATAQTTATVTDGDDGFATSTNGALANALEGSMFIAELQLGLQWDAQLKCFPGRAFVRGALEYQYWNANTNVQASASSFAEVGGSGSADASVSAGDLRFNLVGLTLGAGITY